MEQELLYKYFKGTTSEEEERLILDWVDASPENRKAFQKERMLYDIALFTDEKQCSTVRYQSAGCERYRPAVKSTINDR